MDIRRFSSAEFRGWWERLSPRLLVVIDVFADRWGPPVRVSPAIGAIGRRDGADGPSQHNADRWDEVRAVDLMPEGMETGEDAARAVLIATGVGATGIGVYPHWRPRPGLHLDVRTDRTPGDPALWGAVRLNDRQEYVALQAALDELDRSA